MKSILLFLLFFQGIALGFNLFGNDIIDSVRCTADQNQIYAVYLPVTYSENKNYPTLFFFEPAGRAKLPLFLYKELSDTNEVILICSYNSRNGPFSNNIKAANAMLNDSKLRFNIDTSRIILSGFSGGSRFAYLFTGFFQNKYGVIGCGAGANSLSGNITANNFNYSVIIGNTDFNYTEILDLNEKYKKANQELFFISFEGSHTWPPAEDYERALLYQLWKNTAEPDKTSIRKKIFKLEWNRLVFWLEENNLIAAKWSLENLPILHPTAEEQKKMNGMELKLVKLKDYKKQLRSFKKIKHIEDTLIAEIAIASYGIELTTYNIIDKKKSMGWWHKKIDRYKKLTADSDRYKKLLGQRLQGQIMVNLWEGNRKMISMGYFEQAQEMADILIYLDSTIGSYHALKAEALAGMGKNEEASAIYKTALHFGFTIEKSSFLRNSKFLRILEP